MNAFYPKSLLPLAPCASAEASMSRHSGVVPEEECIAAATAGCVVRVSVPPAPSLVSTHVMLESERAGRILPVAGGPETTLRRADSSGRSSGCRCRSGWVCACGTSEKNVPYCTGGRLRCSERIVLSSSELPLSRHSECAMMNQSLEGVETYA